MTANNADVTVDARETLCPEPILAARKAIADMRSGQTLLVLATDPHAVLDFEAFCARFGHALIEQSSAGRELQLLLRLA